MDISEYNKNEINAKLSASINQTHPHINPENIVTMLKDKLGILSGDVTKEQYDIIRIIDTATAKEHSNDNS